MTEITPADLALEIEAGWAKLTELSADTKGPIRTAVDEALLALDSGRLRVQLGQAGPAGFDLGFEVGGGDRGHRQRLSLTRAP